MTSENDNSRPLRNWFAGLVESNFQTKVGLCDPSLLDYLVDLLTEFVHVERINTLSDGSGRHIAELADSIHRIDPHGSPQDESRLRDLHRHIGDYTLFWTGVYPENLRRLRHRPGKEDLLSFFETGKRSYSIASRLSPEGVKPPGDLLDTLSQEFESCVYGLGLVRSDWERGVAGGPSLLSF